MKRRNFILGSAASIGVGVSIPNFSTRSFPQKTNQETFTAEEALRELVEGNQRFVAGKSKHPRTTEDWLKRLTKGQRPLATILSCSDSRVPLELLFDQGFGDLFTIRVAGNIVTRYGIGSMEYAQHHLHTPLYMVLGHEGCGAVTAAMLPKEKQDEEPQGVRELLDLVHLGDLDPKADKAAQLASAVEANAIHSTKKLIDLDPAKEGFQVMKNELLVTAVYEISTGRVRIVKKWHAR